MKKLFKIFQELKRRNVIKAAISYLIVSWVIIQVVSVVTSIFSIPGWFAKGVFILLIIGLPFWLIFAWIYELTPEGFIRTENVNFENSNTLKKTGKKLNTVIISFLSIAICFLIVDRIRIKDTINDDLNIDNHINNETPSIAVLPFIDLSPNNDQEYFSDGLSEELLNLLAKINSLKVTSRTSAFTFKDSDLDIPAIAKKLDVAYILEGSVRKYENQLRITVQLIKVDDDTHLWSETWDRKLINVFEIQEEIAKTVVNYLKVKLIDDESPKVLKTDSDAYALFLKAKHSYNLSSVDKLIDAENYALESLKIDSTYTPAWALLSEIFLMQGNYGAKPPKEATQLAIEAANKSVALDSTYALGYAILGDIALASEWDFKKAKKLIEKANQLEPNNAQILNISSAIALSTGNLNGAIRIQENAVIIDPLNAETYFGLGVSYFNANRFEEAELTIKKTLELNPSYWSGKYFLSKIIMEQGRLKEALKVTEDDYDLGWKLNNKALIYYKMGDLEKSEYYTNQIIEKYGSEMALQLAEIYAYSNQIDKAFYWLENGYENHDMGLNEMLLDPELTNLHNDPRWNTFIEKMGFN